MPQENVKKVVTVCSIIMKSWNIKASFFQKLMSLFLYVNKTRQAVLNALQTCGICQSRSSTIRIVDAIVEDRDEKILKWKKHVESYNNAILDVDADDIHSILNSHGSNDLVSDGVNDQPEAVCNNLEKVNNAGDQSDGVSCDEEAESDNESCVSTIGYSTEETHPGFCLGWDNVQFLQKAGQQGGIIKNQMKMFTMCYVAKCRINFMPYESFDTVTPAQELDIQSFLTSKQDNDHLKYLMTYVVKKIIALHISCFNIKVRKPSHIFTHESSSKSEVINLGVIHEDPASVKGVINVMSHLHKYVPVKGNGNIVPLVACGDGLSVEQYRCTEIKSKCSNEDGKAVGMEPSPQEWHHRKLVLQKCPTQYQPRI